MLCAAVDTHPDPIQLQRCFDQQMAHTLTQQRPHNLEALTAQTQAWSDRIRRRAQQLASLDADQSAASLKSSYIQ